MSGDPAPSALARQLAAERLILRCYGPDDAEALGEAITASLAHLRPWMPWISFEPQSVDARRALIDQWEAERLAGGDAMYGIWAGGDLVGSCGLHRRGPAESLEIGYWVRAARVARGIATAAAGALTDAALAQPGISWVGIRHDRNNVASSGVPRRLGYRYVGSVHRVPETPAESGELLCWRRDRADLGERDAR